MIESGADRERPRPGESTAPRRAVLAAQSGATLGAWIAAIGFLQNCCVGAPVAAGYRASDAEQALAWAAIITSLTGGLFAVPCWMMFSRGIGGRRGGPRYDNFESRVERAVAAQPRVLPLIFTWGAIASCLVAASEVIASLAMMRAAPHHLVSIVVALILGTVASLAAAWFIRNHRRYAQPLRDLPAPQPPPKGALPVGGSLESAALLFARYSQRAAGFGALAGGLWLSGIVLALLFAEDVEAFAGVPLAAVTTWCCAHAYRGLRVHVRQRDRKVITALLFGVFGGVAGVMPAIVSGVALLGPLAGWWTLEPHRFPSLLRYALAQPGGVVFAPFVIPLGFCGFTLAAFGRELATSKSQEDRSVEADLVSNA